jgi:hypothetical protein
MMSVLGYRELSQRLSELNSEKEVFAFMHRVAKQYGKDDPW